MLRMLAAMLVAISAVGCASSYPPAPAHAAQADYKYIIGPGDMLNIVVWRNPELSTTVPVRPDGRITTPLVEDMVAQGKNPSQLAREIETALKKYLQDPVVTVVVANFGAANSEQVRVIGQATRPATLPYRQNMTLLDVMIAVGGLTDFAAGNRAVLIRAAENNKEYNVRLTDLVKRGDVKANVQVLPGDVIIIPESWF
ncbi:MAG: polysaccharide export protein [Burkholderiaceae bacterium]|nr:polysaccharide export protein [Burkholderiaceae bacterium]